ncbi:MAG: GNAT family N-acetyltransferase [Chloroflexota bacterium]
MKELTSDQFPITQALFAGMAHFVIPQAVLSGHNPGRIFVDDGTHPAAAFLWTPCGFYFLAGKAEDVVFRRDLSSLLFDELIPEARARGENGFVFIPSDPGWSTHWDVILQGRRPIQIYRRIFGFDAACFAAARAGLRTLPAGYRLAHIDAACLVRFADLGAEVAATWGDADAFLVHGRGFCLSNGAELVSACLSVFASDTAEEISIHTTERSRRQGWGAVTAAALIEDCLASGRHPNWECWWENEPSVKLAEKLGYTMLQDYPVWYWEEESILSPKNKPELLTCIHQSWHALMQAIAGRDLGALAPNGWTICDHLAHITAWEHFILRNQLQGLPVHEALQLAPESLAPFDIDRVNAALLERSRRRPAAEVLADLHAVHGELLAALEAAGEEALVRRTQIFDAETNPILIWVLYNTRDHYDEHVQSIQQIDE